MKTSRKNSILLLCLLLLIVGLVGCNAETKLAKNFQLSKTELTLMTTHQEPLILTDLEKQDVGDYTVTWVSDNSSVATVSDTGVVEGVSAGTCTISAVVKTKDAEVRFPCSVTVTENTVEIISLSFVASIYTLGAGQTLNLAPEVEYYPANAARQTLIWTSSNTGIAVVQNGIVAPLAGGVTTITATTADGRIATSCMVQVSEVAIDATGISFEQEEYTIAAGRTMLLRAKVEPENATGYSILWSSSDPDVATVSGGTITAVAPGAVTISAQLNVGGGNLFAECTVIVTEASGISVPATKIQLTPSYLYVTAGEAETHQFAATVTPANTTEQLQWSCSRDDLIVLNPVTGEFTVPETAIITEPVAVVITCSAGSVSDTAVVYINPARPRLVLNETQITLFDKKPFNTAELLAAITTSDELPDVSWRSTNPAVASVDEQGMVVAKRAGTCIISAVNKDDSSMTATCTVTVEKATYLSVEVNQTITIDRDLLPADTVTIVGTQSHFTFDSETKTITGVKSTEDKSVAITIYSATDATKSVTLQVYVVEPET